MIGETMDRLSVIAAFAAAISAIAVAITVILLLLQLKRMRLAQEVTVVLGLYDRSTSSEMLEAATWVKTAMPDDIEYDDYCRDTVTRSRLERLWYYFEFLGVLVNRGYVSEEMVFDQQGAFIAGIWDKTCHLIKARREDRQSPQYMENFEILTNRFRFWASQNEPKLTTGKRKIDAYYDRESTRYLPHKVSEN
jgi:uncharacterized protein DUF4760